MGDYLSKNKLLILNGSHSEIPLICAAKDLGFYVITTGNAPDLIGHQYADEFHYADYSDYRSILELAKALKIDAVCACANDFGAITAAYISEEMNLPGHDTYETTLTLHHKDRFKNLSVQLNLPTPKCLSFISEEEALSCEINLALPLMIKPIDLTGGKGISKIYTYKNYVEAIKYAFYHSPSKKIVVEEFFEGEQFSLSTFIVKKKVVQFYLDNEFSFLNPFLVSTSATSSDVVSSFVDKLIIYAEKLSEELSLVDGVLHFQILKSGENLTIIEITRRCSGDLYPLPVSYACSIDWANYIVRAETGAYLLDISPKKQKGYFGRHCIMAECNGYLNDVVISDEIKNNIVDNFMWSPRKKIITNYLTEKLGVVVLKFDSKREMDTKIKSINEHIKVIVTPL